MAKILGNTTATPIKPMAGSGDGIDIATLESKLLGKISEISSNTDYKKGDVVIARCWDSGGNCAYYAIARCRKDHTSDPNIEDEFINDHRYTDYWLVTSLLQTVSQSVRDANGNVINETYATKDETNDLQEDISTVESIAKGANQAVVFSDYEAMISALNTLSSDKYRVGQNIMIITLNVPDLWVSDISEKNFQYPYTTDEDFMNDIELDGIVQVGNYILSPLETQKVDLTNYVKNTDYATIYKAGLVKLSPSRGIGANDVGLLYIKAASEAQIQQRTDQHLPIVPNNLDYAIKTSITDNSIELTDEEQNTALNWLGVTDKLSNFIINVTIDKEGNIVADQNYNDIVSAYNKGKTVRCKVINNIDYSEFAADMYMNGESCFFVTVHNEYVVRVHCGSDDDWNFVKEEIGFKAYIDDQIGNIETVLDNIIAIQNSYIGGAEE